MSKKTLNDYIEMSGYGDNSIDLIAKLAQLDEGSKKILMNQLNQIADKASEAISNVIGNSYPAILNVQGFEGKETAAELNENEINELVYKYVLNHL